MARVLVGKADGELVMEEKVTGTWRQRSECHSHNPANTEVTRMWGGKK